MEFWIYTFNLTRRNFQFLIIDAFKCFYYDRIVFPNGFFFLFKNLKISDWKQVKKVFSRRSTIIMPIKRSLPSRWPRRSRSSRFHGCCDPTRGLGLSWNGSVSCSPAFCPVARQGTIHRVSWSTAKRKSFSGRKKDLIRQLVRTYGTWFCLG